AGGYGGAMMFPITPAGTISRPDMLAQIIARLHGSAWLRPTEYCQDLKTGEIIITGGPPNDDPKRLLEVHREAQELLLNALQLRALVAEVERDGRRFALPAMYWQSGSGVAALDRLDSAVCSREGLPQV